MCHVFCFFLDLTHIIAEDLRKYYLNSLCKKLVYPWKPDEYVDFGKIYVPVTIDIKLPGLRAIKRRVKCYEDLFTVEQTDTRYVLSGSPGQGKSSFCAKLAYDWSNKVALKNIKLLFILQLGLMNHESNIEDEIASQLLSVDIDSATLGKLIRDLGSSVILVFDGLDEAQRDLMTHKQAKGNLLKIIRYQDLQTCRVLVATRPWRERDVTQLPMYRRLELQRMSKSDVKAYVQKIFEQNKDDFVTVGLGRRLLSFIEKNELLLDTSIPLIVLLISWYWVETNGEKRIPDRISELYHDIITVMCTKRGYRDMTKVSSLHRGRATADKFKKNMYQRYTKEFPKQIREMNHAVPIFFLQNCS